MDVTELPTRVAILRDPGEESRLLHDVPGRIGEDLAPGDRNNRKPAGQWIHPHVVTSL